MPAKYASPWKTISSVVKYRNHWVTMREDTVVRPDKKPGIYGVLEIPDGVGIVALSPNRKLYLIGEWRYPIHKYSWSIICGTQETNETPLAAAKRELAEEARLISTDWKKLGTIHPSPGLIKETAFLFLARNCRFKKRINYHQDSSEKFNLKLTTIDNAVKMIKHGHITDSYAVCSILLAKDQLDHEE